MCFLRPTILLLLLLLCACGKTETRPSTYASGGAERPASDTTVLANAVLFRAMSLVGTRYRYGGNTPEAGFDCSGLVGYVFRDAAGIRLPRTSADIGKLKRPDVSLGHLQSGDLVLFAAHRKISHVGIYVGNGRFVHAPNSGGTVRLDRLDAPGWKETFRSGKRVIQ
ncbi:MAG TPA: C40 family peptidase [Dokdonella sp.]|uniref:C40 family peptidase n=1 Tax=Dokdonella sp. TaxID=2291710 RepID=UPI002D7EDB5C|nr:C40 family peptidase [Dokdonella sp.]HET9033311.1 C40 family peptidase [Dokdonella sp.]